MADLVRSRQRVVQGNSVAPELRDQHKKLVCDGSDRQSTSRRWTGVERDTAEADRYGVSVSGPRVPGGVVHKLPGDLRVALIANPAALDAWKDITPLARNEFICWVEDAKQKMTRDRRIRRTQEELEEGQRRPCCWPGCSHRERTGRER
jgi:Bacteriocin-protection, YdeI or OmpD-Associated